MITPTDMDMQMDIFGIMNAATNNLTLMGMIPYIKSSMNHVTRKGVRFKTGSEGLGDIKLTGLYKILERGNHKLLLNAGISFPTGFIDKEDDTPAVEDQQLPYPMQLGSGTFDIPPGVTYVGRLNDFSWGAQTIGTVRLGENDRVYTLGNKINLTTCVR